jgi:hypothetical protein
MHATGLEVETDGWRLGREELQTRRKVGRRMAGGRAGDGGRHAGKDANVGRWGGRAGFGEVDGGRRGEVGSTAATRGTTPARGGGTPTRKIGWQAIEPRGGGSKWIM